MNAKPHLLLLAAATFAGLMAGCGTTAGYKQADKTGAGIAELRDEVVNLKKAVDASVTALDQIAITADTDPRKAYGDYDKAVNGVESAANKAKARAEKMKEQGNAYFTQWEQQLATVNNEEIRKLAEQRKTKLREAFDSIKAAAQASKDAFPPYLSDLKDLRTFLGNDLTIAGVDAAKPFIVKAKDHGVTLQKAMDEFIAQMNTVAAAITPAKVAPKKQ